MITPEQIAKNGSEHAEQAALFCWAALYSAEHDSKPPGHWQSEISKKLKMLFAIPNGDQRGDGTTKGAMIAGARLKAEGQRNGVPDTFLPVVRPTRTDIPTNVVYHGLFIEMKRRTLKKENNALAGCSDEQKDWITRLRAQGYACAVCYGWEEARDTILLYLGA